MKTEDVSSEVVQNVSYKGFDATFKALKNAILTNRLRATLAFCTRAPHEIATADPSTSPLQRGCDPTFKPERRQCDRDQTYAWRALNVHFGSGPVIREFWSDDRFVP